MELIQPLRSRASVIGSWALTGLIAVGVANMALAAPLALRPGMGGVPDLGAIRCETFNAMYPAGPNGLRQAILYWMEGYVYARTGKTMDEFLASPGWIPGILEPSPTMSLRSARRGLKCQCRWRSWISGPG
jgi:hypothetical protein